MPHVDVDTYMEKVELGESRILGFKYQESSQCVELVIEYVAERLDQHARRVVAGLPPLPGKDLLRDFRRLLLCGVSSMQVQDPLTAYDADYWKILRRTIDGPGGFTIQVAEYRLLEGCFLLRLVCDNDRTYTIVFESLEAEKKLGRPVRDEANDTWGLFDTSTGEEIAVCSPFG